MLPAADRADFAVAYAAALEEARRTWSLQPVDEVLEQWRRIAILPRSPGHKKAIEDGLRLNGRPPPAEPSATDELSAGKPPRKPAVAAPLAGPPIVKISPQCEPGQK